MPDREIMTVEVKIVVAAILLEGFGTIAVFNKHHDRLGPPAPVTIVHRGDGVGVIRSTTIAVKNGRPVYIVFSAAKQQATHVLLQRSDKVREGDTMTTTFTVEFI